MARIKIGEILECTKGELLAGSEDTVIKGFCVNSKKIRKGDMFIPTIGEKTDGHKFMRSALKSGAVATLTSREISKEDMLEGKAYIKVDDTLKAFQAIAKTMREALPLPVVGVTGSVGKTTTKEMIAAVLEMERNTFKTEGNMNSQIGLSMMMTRMKKEHTAAVIEMGVSEPNEMDTLSSIAKPDFFVITNIGVSHIAQFGTQENILKEKACIVNGFELENSKTFAYDLKDINTLFVNGDDKYLRKLADYAADPTIECDLSEKTKKALENTKVVTFGIDSECDYRATNIIQAKNRVHFDVAYKEKVDTVLRDKMEHVVLSVLGRHNIYNALVAIAVGECFNIPPVEAKIGIHDYESLDMRGNIEEFGGVKVIDDTYNASPDSMKSGIDVLLSVEDIDRRVAVLADILELGEYSRESHYEVGKYIADKNIDEVIVVGTEAKTIVEAIKDLGGSMTTSSFDSNEEAIKYIDTILKPRTAMLFKGSRGMKVDEIVSYIKENAKNKN